VNREMVTRAGLKLLDEVGLEKLTLRALAKELKIQAPTVYWHFKSKEELINEMASTVLAEAAPALVPGRKQAEWSAWCASFGQGLRRALLRYRDGARMVAGSRLTNTNFMKTAEAIGTQLLEAGFTARQSIVLLSTIYSYTVSFAMEEQAVFPKPGERSELYDLEKRSDQLREEGLPLMRQAGPILFDRFDRRYKEGLELLVAGATVQLGSRGSAARP
jgi:TetR/AcrR family tetracycline transcriptional repressor